MQLSDLTEQASAAVSGAGDYLRDMTSPTLRLGVTGLSRSGKTVFITALIQNLTRQGWLPFFDPVAEGRLLSGHLLPPPPAMDLFDYDRFVALLASKPPEWPERTNSISELRIALTYQPGNALRSMLGPRRLTLEIVDYPGEWLLDLPLLAMDFAGWSRETLASARQHVRADIASQWLAFTDGLDPTAPLDTGDAQKGADLFRAYLKAAREEQYAFSCLPPGRYLEPGGEAYKPMMNFIPLELPNDKTAPDGSLWQQMDLWFEAYKREIVTPFFRDHFARIDRQIVLVDLLRTLNAGPDAVRDLEHTLGAVLNCFRHGKNSVLTRWFRPRIDKVLIAATKADHLHSSSYTHLRDILEHVTRGVQEDIGFSGATVGFEALSAIRATKHATVKRGGETLDCVAGIPLAGEQIDGRTYDGRTEAVIFPGELPDDPATALRVRQDMRFVRFRPPVGQRDQLGQLGALAHVRLDHALQFLLADRMT